MDLFGRLRQHALLQPEVHAMVSSRHRNLTFRKLWNRIERATARLQNEWGIGEDDVVAYSGQAHPDALVLYLALVRSAARLLPFESPAVPGLKSQIPLLLQKLNVKTVLYDQGSLPDLLPESSSLTCRHLDELIMVRSPYQPFRILEELDKPSLITLHFTADQSFVAKAISMQQMLHANQPNMTGQVLLHLFNREVLGHTVLPVLYAGGTLGFP